MAYIDYGEWFNPYSEEYETVEGVWCECWECKRITSCNWAGPEKDVFFTKNEYREHRNERRLAYEARENNKIIRKQELKSAHTKETEALEGHGRPSSVPTFFDIDTGGKQFNDHLSNPGAGWSRLWRASIREF